MDRGKRGEEWESCLFETNTGPGQAKDHPKLVGDIGMDCCTDALLTWMPFNEKVLVKSLPVQLFAAYDLMISGALQEYTGQCRNQWIPVLPEMCA